MIRNPELEEILAVEDETYKWIEAGVVEDYSGIIDF